MERPRDRAPSRRQRDDVAVRLRLLIATDNPDHRLRRSRIRAALIYDRPLDASLAAFKAARLTSAEILDRLSEAQWERKGTHTESGAYGVERWLDIYSKHAHNHADQIRAARHVVTTQTGWAGTSRRTKNTKRTKNALYKT
jgi:hypothetical protein